MGRRMQYDEGWVGSDGGECELPLVISIRRPVLGKHRRCCPVAGGGGETVVHSSDLEPQGLSAAFLPLAAPTIQFNRDIANPRARITPPAVMISCWLATWGKSDPA